MSQFLFQLLIATYFTVPSGNLVTRNFVEPELGMIQINENPEIEDPTLAFIVTSPFIPSEKMEALKTQLSRTNKLVVTIDLSSEGKTKSLSVLPQRILSLSRMLEKRYAFQRFVAPEIHQLSPDLSSVAYRSPASRPPLSDSLDLPLITLPPEKLNSKWFVVLYSGDGGWSEFTQDLASEFHRRGIPVVGINSLAYFWTRKDPQQIGTDLGDILDQYSKSWNLSEAHIVGYSFGADILPFAMENLTGRQSQIAREVDLLNPGLNASFEIRLWDWILDSDVGQPINFAFENPDLRFNKVKWKCIYGDQDRVGTCASPTLRQSFPGLIIQLRGDHHFNGNFMQFDGILW